MKYFSAFLLSCCWLSHAATIEVGGIVYPVNTVVCRGNSDLDWSQDGENETIATCVIDNNAPRFQESFRFSLEQNAAQGIQFTSLTFQGLEGRLGRGIDPPHGQNVLPELEGGVFTWTPEEQSSATVGYVVEFRASWKARNSNAPVGPLVVTTISETEE